MLAACLGVMGGFGSLFVYTFTVFVKPLGAEFGWNRESVSLGFTITAMTVGLSSKSPRCFSTMFITRMSVRYLSLAIRIRYSRFLPAAARRRRRPLGWKVDFSYIA